MRLTAWKKIFLPCPMDCLPCPGRRRYASSPARSSHTGSARARPQRSHGRSRGPRRPASASRIPTSCASPEAFSTPSRPKCGRLRSATSPATTGKRVTGSIPCREPCRRGISPLRGLEADPGETGELVLQAQSRAHVVSAMDKSNSFLARHNDLTETIGQHGILREVLLTVVRIDHESEDEPPVWALAGADGSSRISASHRIHALGASDVLYGLPGDDRKYRHLLSQVLGTGERPREEVTPDDVKRARALVAPATLVLRFIPDESSQLQYDQAVKFIVGITHVEPPKPWGTASENDALADPVIEEFLRAGRLTRTRAEWFAADLTPDEVRSNVLDPWHDTRVAEIVSTFLNTEEHALFRKGVLRITAKSKVTADFKAKVVTEMILRPWRAANADADAADRVSGTRSTLQRMLKWTPLQAPGWHASGDNDPDKMLESALRNLKEGGAADEAGVELGVRGGYYLAVHGTLVREARGRTVDYRTPSSVLQRMTENPHGLRTLHRAIVDGRQNRKPQRVDELGTPQLNLNNRPLEADDTWLRTTFTAVGEAVSSPPIEGDVTTPESEFEAAKTHFANLVASLESALVAAECAWTQSGVRQGTGMAPGSRGGSWYPSRQGQRTFEDVCGDRRGCGRGSLGEHG